MIKTYKITNNSLETLTIYNNIGVGFILKPHVSQIVDILPEDRCGLYVEELDDKGDIIRIVDITEEKKKEEKIRIANLIKNQKKKKVKLESELIDNTIGGI